MKRIQGKMGVRSATLASFEAGRFLWDHPYGWKGKKSTPICRMKDLGSILRYGMANRMCNPKRQVEIMNIEQLVVDWVEAIVGMCSAHDKDAYDAHDARADELLGPLLTAPVKQVREFYLKLLEQMKADIRVPMLVWMGFDAWGEVMIKDSPDEGIKRLKNKLAREIAEIVEDDIKTQIPKAIERALRWRDPETLEKVKEKLESGVKPKLRGRESCLFLECGQGKNKVSVML